MTVVDDDRILARVVAELSLVPGVVAIVLSGSRAQGTATPRSDYDIGILYDGETPFSHHSLQQAALALGDPGTDRAVTEIGAWGPWIDGGGWLTVSGQPLDLLYRNIRQVERVAEDCRSGRVEVAYQPGHPHAFVSAMLLGQMDLCRPLWDPGGEAERLKALAQPYPEPLQSALITRFLWESDFAIRNAEKSLSRGDVAYVAGCCFRSISCVMQVLFALNRRYLVNEKGAVAFSETLPIRSDGLAKGVEGTYQAIGAGDLGAALNLLKLTVGGTAGLVRQHFA